MKRNGTGLDLSRWKALAGKYQYALLVLGAGLLLMLVPAGNTAADTADTGESFTCAAAQEDSTDALERKLAETLSAIQGVGEAEVILTLDAGSEQRLAADSETDGAESTTTTVILDSGSGGETTVTTQVIAPVYRGALVVCDGGEDAGVRLAVVEAVRALTGLKTTNISVCARTEGN